MQGRPKTSPASRILISTALAFGLLAFAPGETRAQSCTAPSFAPPLGPAAVGAGARDIAVFDTNRDGRRDIVTADAIANTVSFGLGAGNGNFLVSLSHPTAGAGPVAVTVADFDQDGIEDVAVALNGSNALRALLSDGLGNVRLPLPGVVGVTAGPNAIVAGDFNQDGIPDLAAANGNGDVQIAVGVGAGAFNAAGVINIGAVPRDMTAGDFNRDGRLDVAVVADTPSSIHLVFGDGLGAWLGFNPFPVPLAGGLPVSLAAGDIDNDGDLDVVTGDSASQDLAVLLGNGLGGLVVSPVLPGPLPLTTSLVLADFDRNGVLDLAVTGQTTNQIAAMLGDGAGGFSSPLPLPSPVDLYALAAGDFDGDGLPDLAGSSPPTNTAVVFLDDVGLPCPNSSFAGAGRLQVPIGGGGNPVAIAHGDWDGNAIPDLATAGDGTLSIMFGDGTLRFGPPVFYALAGTADAQGIAVGDFDLDSDPDLATVNRGTDDVSVFLNTGGVLTGPTDYPVDGLPEGVVRGDFDRNGTPDLVTASGSGRVTFLPGLGDGTFGSPTTSTLFPGGVTAVAAADIDGDLVLDLALTRWSEVRWYRGDGTGAFTLGGTIPLSGSDADAVDLGDLNNDGLPDLVTANRQSDDVSVFFNTGGAFGPETLLGVDNEPLSVQIVRANGDAFGDIVVATRLDHTVNVLLGDGAGGFPTINTILGFDQPSVALVVDLDRNGKRDLATVNAFSDGGLYVYSGDGLGWFGPHQVSPGMQERSVATGDFNRDGRPDLVTLDRNSTDLSFFKGLGDGTFDPAVMFPTGLGGSPGGIGVGDFDRNGTLDVIVGSQSLNQYAFLPGDGAGVLGPPAMTTTASPFTGYDGIPVHDFDRDGALDFVKMNGLGDNVTVHHGNGLGAFGPPRTMGVGNSPAALAVLDFNRDGILDLAVATALDASISLLQGTAVQATPFTLVGTLPTDARPYGLAAGDFDRDGLVDLLVAQFASVPAKVGLFPGLPASPFFGPRDDYELGDPTEIEPDGVALADMNLDGRLDALVTCQGGSDEDRASLRVLLGTGSLAPGAAFQPADPWAVAQEEPSVIAVADFDLDGRSDFVTGEDGNNKLNRISVVLNTNCLARRLRSTRNVSLCNTPLTPFATQPAVQVEDHGGNPVQCNDVADPVSVGIVPGTGTGGAFLGGDNPLATTAGVADWAITPSPLSIDLPGSKYRLEFTHPAAGWTSSRTFSLTPSLSVTGPAGFCASGSGLYSTDPGFDTYRWYVDALGPVGFATTQTVGPLLAGPHNVQVDATVDTCPASASQPFDAFADLSNVTVSLMSGSASACTTCVGGTISEAHLDGGVVTHEWGYRTVSTTGPITWIPARTGSTYDINGADFPGPGTYYVVARTTPTCGLPLVSVNEVTVTITLLPPGDEVAFFTVTSRNQENVLEWVNSGSWANVRIRYNAGPTCTFPADANSSGTLLVDYGGTAGARERFPHDTPPLTNGWTYCYTIFSDMGAPVYSVGRSNRGRPMDPSLGVHWAFSTGVFSLTAPTVGWSGIIATSNDHVVHSMQRGLGGGEWPAAWLPIRLNGPVQSRSPIVPITVNGANPVVYLGSQDGNVYVVDADLGGAFGGFPRPPAPLGGSPGQAAPAGIFSAFGGGYDYLLVGTRDTSADNRFFAFTPDLVQAGAPFNNGGGLNSIGIINGMATVEYPNRRVFFTSHARGSADTLWCLQLQTGPPATVLRWSRPHGDIDSSPVLMGDRVYVVAPLPTPALYSIEADMGMAPDRTFPIPDGQAKGFVFPDWRTGDLYFATDNYVWALHDDGSSISNKFPLLAPPGGIILGAGVVPTSSVVFVSGSDYVYVGGSDGKLYEIDVSAGPAPTIKSVVLGDGLAAIGSPSLDWQNGLVHVGTEAGVFYAVEVPLP